MFGTQLVIIIDNGSTDHTHQKIVNSKLFKEKKINFLKIEKNIGYGHGIMAGVNIAKGNFIGWCHADLQTEPIDVVNAYIKNLNAIENDHGRHFKETKFSSRTLDIDILYYDSLIISNEKIKIPRKEIIEYDFVLTPLIDIAPDFIHPELNMSHSDIMENHIIEKKIVKKVDFDI